MGIWFFFIANSIASFLLFFVLELRFATSVRPIQEKLVSADSSAEYLPINWPKLGTSFSPFYIGSNSEYHLDHLIAIQVRMFDRNLWISLFILIQRKSHKKFQIFAQNYVKTAEKRVSAYRPSWPNIRPNNIGRNWPNIRPIIRYRSYTICYIFQEICDSFHVFV